MCKGFSFTLMWSAQKWYSTLPEKKSIKSFSYLVTRFMNHFLDSQKKKG